MQRRIVNTYLLLNLFNSLVGTAIVAASLYDEKAFTIAFWLFPFLIVEWIAFFPAFWSMSRNKKLPFRTFLPLFLVYIFPFMVIGLDKWPEALGNIAVGFVPVYCLVQRQKLFGDKWGRIPQHVFTEAEESFSRLIPIVGAVILSVAVLAGIATIQLVKLCVEESGKDALLLKSDGIYTHQMEFEKDGKKVSVLGMMHFADKSFYDQQIAKMPKQSLVLLEGMMDKMGFMGKGVPNPPTMYGRPYQFGTFNPEVKAKFITYNADIDIGNLSSAQRENELKDMAYGLSYVFRQSKTEREKSKRLGLEVKKIRNERLLGIILKGSQKFQHVIVAWGAGHNAFIEEELLKNGFELKSKTTEKVVSFW